MAMSTRSSFRIASTIAGITIIASVAMGQGPPATPERTVSIPVKVVVLFSSGVGYFEHIGPVTGNASTQLRFKTGQINDILKSLVLQDTSGRVGGIVYPSQDPLARTLTSFQVDITDNPSLGELLYQLRGAKVQVTAGADSLSGTILGMERRPKAVEHVAIPVEVLNILVGDTIRSVQLDGVTRLQLEDAQLQEELNRALSALAQARNQDSRPVTVQFVGEGERLVRLGYVVETPIWKTSYRLIMGEQPLLQGWAIVENQTDSDWSGVQLSLVSGRPISFIQELYHPLYLPRPVVEPDLYASLKPQSYGQGMAPYDVRRDEGAQGGGGYGGGGSRYGGGGFSAGPGYGTGGVLGRMRGTEGSYGGAAYPAAPDRTERPALDPAASVASIASGSQLGELFQYTIADVSLPRQRSAMLPIVTDPIEVEKLSIYNPSVLPQNPLSGARVKNTTGKHLLAGPVTVLEAGSYAGDARIDDVPPGQERLLSYGIDLQMLVNASRNTEESIITSAGIVKGILRLQRKHVFTQEYIAENKGPKDRVLIIEHALRRGLTLVEPSRPIQTTNTHYRFRTVVPANKLNSLTVKEERTVAETLAILPMEIDTLLLYSRDGQIPRPVRDAVARAAALKQAVEATARQIEQQRQQIDQIAQEQVRIRENLKAVTEQGDYRATLLGKLSAQEKQIDAIQSRLKELENTRGRQMRELESYVSSLEIGV